MDSKIFYIGIRDLCEWFNKKLTGNQADLWFQELKYIPDEAFHDAVQKSKDNESYMPKPVYFKKAFAQYRRDHPEMFTLEESKIRTDCMECDGNGYIWAWHDVNKKGNPEWNRIELACGACGNWRRSLPPNRSKFFNKQEILDAGMILIDPYIPEVSDKKTYETVEEMVDEVGMEEWGMPYPEEPEYIPDDKIPF